MSIHNLYLLNQTNHLRAMQTMIRDRNTSQQDFIHYANRINRLLLEEAFNQLPHEPDEVKTPVDMIYKGLKAPANICGVSIVRAGESMEAELRAMCPSIQIGKILIQRDEVSKKPHWMYTKLPKNIENQHVILLEPMLATGGSALAAIEILNDQNVPCEKIILVTVLATQAGIEAVHKKSDKIKIVTSAVDAGLNEDAYIIPGIGDYGDRYFGTD